jgi:Xaa-Pro aminopeptidase
MLTGLHSDYYDLPKLPEGRLVQLDLGCDLDRYHTDTKRPVPVSGHFTPEQKVIWEYFVGAYRAGLTAIHDGARRDDVFEAMIRDADRRKSTVPSAPARKAAAAIIDRQGASLSWLLHSMGLECCEGEPEILRAGMTVAFEPSIIVEGQSYTEQGVGCQAEPSGSFLKW